VTRVTRPAAVVTDGFGTGLAGVGVRSPDVIVTDGAAGSVPAADRDVAATAVVGLERLLQDQEQIPQPSGTKCPCEWLLRVTQAERLIHDVGMGDIAAAGRSDRGLGFDPVGVLENFTAVEDHPEPAQGKPLQFDLLGGDGDRLFPQVPVNHRELVQEPQ